MPNVIKRRWLAAILASGTGIVSTQAALFVETGGRVVIEAEHFEARQTDTSDSKHWHVVPDDNRSDFLNDVPADTQAPDYNGARGTSYIVSLPNSGQNQNTAADVGTAPWIDYRVKISTGGDYQLYLRWAGYDGAADSIYAQIRERTDGAGGTIADWFRYSRTATVDLGWQGDGGREEVSGGSGTGEEPVLWNLTPGNYTIRVSQREDGSAVDALILQLASMAAPEEPGPAESSVEGLLIAKQPSSAVISPGGSATLTVQVLASGTVTYQWQKAAPSSSVFADVSGGTAATLNTGALQASDAGTKYRVQVTGGGTNLTSREATIQVDAGPPTLVSALGGPDLNRVTVTFSEKLDPATAATTGNYTIPGLTVNSATLSASGTIVTLGTTAQTGGTVYTLTVNGVRDLVGNAISNGAIGFQGASRQRGGLRVDLYQGITGTAVDLLTADAKYPANPDLTIYWNSFGPIGAGNPYGDNYGGRATGWIVPAQTGDHKFYLRSDDASQLWLSSDDTAASLVMIAEQTGCCNAFTDTEGTLSSTPINLTAGRRYYVQALWKEGGGDDYLQVAWRTPADPDLNSVTGLVPIPGQFLETVVDPTSSITITQQPTNATAAASTPVTFSVAFTASSAFGTNATVQWQKAPSGSSTFTDINGATGGSYTIPFANPADNNAKFRAVVSVGALTNKTSAEATLTVSSESNPPQLTGASGNATTITVLFNEPVDPASVAAGGFTISGATVTAATVASSATQPGVVRLTATGLTPGQQYTLNVTGVKDLSGNTIAAGASRSFTVFHISENFGGGVPAGAGISGAASILPTGELQLTTNAGSLQGSLTFPDALNGAAVNRFTATFRLYIGNGSGNPADGFSFNVASDLMPDPASPPNFGEEGTGSGLTVAFDTYDNGNAEAPAISLKFAGNEFATTNLAKAIMVNNQWVDVVIKVDADGTIDVQHNNVKYYDNFPVEGWTPIAGAQVGIGARTGGEFERHLVDDFNVLFNADITLPQPPTISITSPTPNQTFAAGSTVTITATATDPEGQIAKVEFFANGTKLGEDTTAPYSFTVPSAPQGVYNVTARVTDAQGLAVTSAAVKAIVGNPEKVLYVHGSGGPNASDNLLMDWLITQGFDPVAVGASTSVTEDANGKTLVILSSTVASGEVAEKFTTVAVPVLNWEQALQDNLLFTGDVANTDRENITGQSQLNIIAAHPIVGGLNGLVTVSDATVDMAWGLPGPGAVRIAQVADGTPRFPLYVYDTGALLVDGTTAAAARRVHVPMTDNAYAGLNATGRQIIHNAILWAMGKPIGGTTQPTASISRSGGNVTITSTDGGTVQGSPTLAPATWTDVGPAPQTVSATTGVRFFRIRK